MLRSTQQLLPEEEQSPDDTTESSTSESYIANTGGRAISSDGLLTILVGPNVFPDGASMRIQAQDSQMPGTNGQEYFVSLVPADVCHSGRWPLHRTILWRKCD